MDNKLLKRAAFQSVTLMIAVIALSYTLHKYQNVTIAASNGSEEALANNNTETSENLVQNVGDLKTDITEALLSSIKNDAPKSENSDIAMLLKDVDIDILTNLSDDYLIITKPAGENISLKLDDLYIEKSIRINIEGLLSNELDSSMVARVRGNELFVGDPEFTETVSIKQNEENGTSEEVITKDYGTDLSHGITISTKANVIIPSYSAEILIALDSVYAYKVYEDAYYYYIDLRKPSEVYDKILVIDPGHGGKDGGAISRDGQYFEKNINLDIALQLKELLDLEDIKVYYTRTEDATVYLRPREELANAVDCDYFVSIHCNANTIPGPNGMEVLYYDTEFKGIKEYELASLFSEELSKSIELKNRGIVKKQYEDIYIMDKSVVPMVLIEVGYLSNPSDMAFLSNAYNRKTVAQGIYNSIMRAYNELPVLKEQ
ncbi:MAG: N-acetylmuramoyl-L-alanine amidase [Mobilitalea sp.]